ncbi:hypothetical protein WAB73_003243 [Salmonella enterica subsp. enterica]
MTTGNSGYTTKIEAKIDTVGTIQIRGVIDMPGTKSDGNIAFDWQTGSYTNGDMAVIPTVVGFQASGSRINSSDAHNNVPDFCVANWVY